ncbi:MAG: hypothetical protein ACE5J9_09545, partial [Methanosarcinales archaeon]
MEKRVLRDEKIIVLIILFLGGCIAPPPVSTEPTSPQAIHYPPPDFDVEIKIDEIKGNTIYYTIKATNHGTSGIYEIYYHTALTANKIHPFLEHGETRTISDSYVYKLSNPTDSIFVSICCYNLTLGKEVSNNFLTKKVIKREDIFGPLVFLRNISVLVNKTVREPYVVKEPYTVYETTTTTKTLKEEKTVLDDNFRLSKDYVRWYRWKNELTGQLYMNLHSSGPVKLLKKTYRNGREATEVITNTRVTEFHGYINPLHEIRINNEANQRISVDLHISEVKYGPKKVTTTRPVTKYRYVTKVKNVTKTYLVKKQETISSLTREVLSVKILNETLLSEEAEEKKLEKIKIIEPFVKFYVENTHGKSMETWLGAPNNLKGVNSTVTFNGLILKVLQINDGGTKEKNRIEDDYVKIYVRLEYKGEVVEDVKELGIPGNVLGKPCSISLGTPDGKEGYDFALVDIQYWETYVETPKPEAAVSPTPTYPVSIRTPTPTISPTPIPPLTLSLKQKTNYEKLSEYIQSHQDYFSKL